MKNFVLTLCIATAAISTIPAFADAHESKRTPSASQMDGYGSCAKGPCTRRARFSQGEMRADVPDQVVAAPRAGCKRACTSQTR